MLKCRTKNEFKGSCLSEDILCKRIIQSDWPRKCLHQNQAVKPTSNDLINSPFPEKPTHTQNIRIIAQFGLDILHI